MYRLIFVGVKYIRLVKFKLNWGNNQNKLNIVENVKFWIKISKMGFIGLVVSSQ